MPHYFVRKHGKYDGRRQSAPPMTASFNSCYCHDMKRLSPEQLELIGAIVDGLVGERA